MFYFIATTSSKVQPHSVGKEPYSEIAANLKYAKVGAVSILHNGVEGKNCLITNDRTLIISGHIRNAATVWENEKSNQLFFEKICLDLENISNSEFRNSYTGSYSLLYINKNGMQLMTILSAVNFMYYYSGVQGVVVSNNLIWMQEVAQAKLYYPSVIQNLCTYYKEVFYRKTVLENVFRLESCERVRIQDSIVQRIKSEFYPIAAEHNSVEGYAGFMWNLYKEEVRLFCGNEGEFTICLSGGLDSRLLAVAMKSFSKIKAINHGEKDFYETQIAQRIAKQLNIPFYISSDTNTAFPPLHDMDKFIIHGGGCISEYVHLTQVMLENNLPTEVLLGDLFECLDARGSSFMSSRKNKVNYVKQRLLGKKLITAPYNSNSFELWKKEKKSLFLQDITVGRNFLKQEFNEFLNTHPDFLIQLETDIEEFLNEFSYYKVKSIEDLNEIYGWLTKARLFHARQLNSFSGYAQAHNITASDQFLAHSLGVPVEYRVRKRVIYAIANSNEFKAIRHIPTVQVPFIPTTSPLLLRELMLFTRFNVDKIWIKKTMKKKGNIRNRVANSLNCKYEFESDAAFQNLDSWFTNDYINKELLVTRFTETRNGLRWPLGSILFVSLMKSERMLNRLKKGSL